MSLPPGPKYAGGLPDVPGRLPDEKVVDVKDGKAEEKARLTFWQSVARSLSPRRNARQLTHAFKHRKRFLFVAWLGFIGALGATLVSWKITNDAGERAVIGLGKTYQKDAIVNFRQSMDHQVASIRHFHNHVHEFREMAGLDVTGTSSGDNFFLLQKFLASWLYHYARGEACCVGQHTFRHSSYNAAQWGTASDSTNYGNPYANGGGVLLQPRDGEPGLVNFRLIGYSNRQGSSVNNITAKVIPEEQRWDATKYTPGWQNDPIFPDKFFHVGDNHAGTWVPCSKLKDKEFTFLPVKAASNLDGAKPGIDLKACSGLYVTEPDGVTRTPIGILNGGFYLQWMARWLSELTIVTEKKAFVMAIEIPTGHLVAASDTKIDVTVNDEAGKPQPAVATAHSDAAWVNPVASAVLSEACGGNWETCPADDNVETKLNGETYFLQVGRYENSGIKWMVVVAMSKNEMLGEILNTRREIVIFALVAATAIKILFTLVGKAWLFVSYRIWPVDAADVAGGIAGDVKEFGLGEFVTSAAG